MRALRNNLFLLAMIVIIPAVSWMFLRTGVDYRLESLKDLEMKKPFLYSNLLADSIKFEDKVTLINLAGNDAKVAQLYDQFKEAPGFQLISANGSLSNPTDHIDNLGNLILLNDIESLGIVNYVDFKGGVYALIDGEGQLRRVYNSDEEIKSVVRHIATIIPYVEKNKRRKK